MPVMSGIDMFTAASRQDPGIAQRFLFLTGNPTDETLAFFKEHRLPYLTKPMRIQEIEEAIHRLTEQFHASGKQTAG